MVRALKIALAHAAALVCALFVTLLTLVYAWPTDVERRGAIVESVSVDFGLPISFATARVTDGNGQPWIYAEESGMLRTYNPWENPADFHGNKFLLSWLVFAAVSAAVVELCRWLIRRRPALRIA
jgi:hypothetical protein